MTVVRSSRRCGSSSGSPAGTTAVAPGAQVGDQLGLGGGDRLQRAEQLQVRRADVDDHADVRLRDRRQLGDLPSAAHPHLQHQRLRAGRRGEQLQRQPDLGVEVAAADERAAVRLQERGEDVLRGGLAGRAGDRDRLRAQLAAPGAREPLERCQRVLGGEHRACALSELLRMLRRDEHAPGARPRAPARRSGRRRASRPGRPTNRSPATTARESIATRAGPPASAAPGAARRAPAASATCCGVHDLIARPLRPSARSASRATVTSSNGSFSPPASSWPCSWPLPAITTTSPASARGNAHGDRGAAVDLDATPGTPAASGMPATISSTIASGCSERGLSEVTTVRPRAARAIAPICGRLPLSRSPPQPKTHEQAARRSARARPAGTFSSESGVCA